MINDGEVRRSLMEINSTSLRGKRRESCRKLTVVETR